MHYVISVDNTLSVLGDQHFNTITMLTIVAMLTKILVEDYAINANCSVNVYVSSNHTLALNRALHVDLQPLIALLRTTSSLNREIVLVYRDQHQYIEVFGL